MVCYLYGQLVQRFCCVAFWHHIDWEVHEVLVRLVGLEFQDQIPRIPISTEKYVHNILIEIAIKM